MMVAGISGMAIMLFIGWIFRDIKTCDLMLFCIWAVVAICGAIRKVK